MARQRRTKLTNSIGAYNKRVVSDANRILNDYLKKNPNLTNSQYYRYGEKDSNYMATVAAISSAKDRWRLADDVKNDMQDDRDFRPSKILPKNLTSKARNDYLNTYRSVSENIASELRQRMVENNSGRLVMKSAQNVATVKKKASSKRSSGRSGG